MEAARSPKSPAKPTSTRVSVAGEDKSAHVESLHPGQGIGNQAPSRQEFKEAIGAQLDLVMLGGGTTRRALHQGMGFWQRNQCPGNKVQGTSRWPSQTHTRTATQLARRG